MCLKMCGSARWAASGFVYCTAGEACAAGVTARPARAVTATTATTANRRDIQRGTALFIGSTPSWRRDVAAVNANSAGPRASIPTYETIEV
ncbi:hypothetical protein GCM10027184_53670 [Saccharothrix stipae]